MGEATGLRWDDVNLETGSCRSGSSSSASASACCYQELKTAKSRRTLALPQVCVALLNDHRKRQLEERLKAGANGTDTGLVFTTFARRGADRHIGAPLHPRNVLRTLHTLWMQPDSRACGSTICGTARRVCQRGHPAPRINRNSQIS